MNSKIIGFAIEAHAKVNHLYDGKPYSVHLAMVAMYALKYKEVIVNNETFDIVMDACWLHDTIEDCRLTYNDIKAVAGEYVADMVYALTNEKGKNRKERANGKYYTGIIEIPFARFVKLCDRLANVKYSVDSNSKMLSIYQKENTHFIESIIPSGRDKRIYKDMINELENLLYIVPFNTSK